MEPGLELDKLIAEKVMGWTDVEESHPVSGGPVLQGIRAGEIPSKHTGYRPKFVIPKYSSEIEHAWQVVEKLRDDNFSIEENGTHWKARFGTHWRGAENAPHAICLAALEAKK